MRTTPPLNNYFVAAGLFRAVARPLRTVADCCELLRDCCELLRTVSGLWRAVSGLFRDCGGLSRTVASCFEAVGGCCGLLWAVADCFTGQATHADPNGANGPGMLKQRILNKNTIGVGVLVCNN